MSLNSTSPTSSCNLEKKITFEVPLDDSDSTLGVTINDNLVIVKILKRTVGEQFLQIGDIVVSLNGIPIRDQNTFYKLIDEIEAKVILTISRNDTRTNEMLSKIQIPKNRESNIVRRNGYEYFLATLTVCNGKKLGICIRHFGNKVFISKCEKGSMSDEIFIPGDRICDVEGIPVSDKDVCKKLIIKYLQMNNTVTLIIERPDSEEIEKLIEKLLSRKNNSNPSYRMNSDVKEIAAMERQKIKAYEKPTKSILSTNPNQNSKGITFENDVLEYYIVSDNEGKELRKVRK